MDKNSKRMTPEEIAKFYDCNGKEGPKCPIVGWCMNHEFTPDTCEETWRQYLALQDKASI